MNRIPLDKFIALLGIDLLQEKGIPSTELMIEDAVVAFATDFINPYLIGKFGAPNSEIQNYALRSIGIGGALYAYNWLMKNPNNMQQIAVKSIGSELLLYGYRKYA